MRYLHTLVGLGLAFWRGACESVLLVRGTGVDVGDCQLSPCLSLSYAISQVQVNDIIRIGAGIFKGGLNRNLNPGSLGKNNFTIEGRKGRVAVQL